MHFNPITSKEDARNRIRLLQRWAERYEDWPGRDAPQRERRRDVTLTVIDIGLQKGMVAFSYGLRQLQDRCGIPQETLRRDIKALALEGTFFTHSGAPGRFVEPGGSRAAAVFRLSVDDVPTEVVEDLNANMGHYYLDPTRTTTSSSDPALAGSPAAGAKAPALMSHAHSPQAGFVRVNSDPGSPPPRPVGPPPLCQICDSRKELVRRGGLWASFCPVCDARPLDVPAPFEPPSGQTGAAPAPLADKGR